MTPIGKQFYGCDRWVPHFCVAVPNGAVAQRPPGPKAAQVKTGNHRLGTGSLDSWPAVPNLSNLPRNIFFQIFQQTHSILGVVNNCRNTSSSKASASDSSSSAPRPFQTLPPQLLIHPSPYQSKPPSLTHAGFFLLNFVVRML